MLNSDFLADVVVQLGRLPRRFDLLTRIDGVVFADCCDRRETLTVDGLKLNLIGLGDFKTNKQAAGTLAPAPRRGAHRQGTQAGGMA